MSISVLIFLLSKDSLSFFLLNMDWHWALLHEFWGEKIRGNTIPFYVTCRIKIHAFGILAHHVKTPDLLKFLPCWRGCTDIEVSSVSHLSHFENFESRCQSLEQTNLWDEFGPATTSWNRANTQQEPPTWALLASKNVRNMNNKWELFFSSLGLLHSIDNWNNIRNTIHSVTLRRYFPSYPGPIRTTKDIFHKYL